MTDTVTAEVPSSPDDVPAEAEVRTRRRFPVARIKTILRAYPVTIAILLTLVVVALVTGSFWRRLIDDPDRFELVAHGYPQFAAGRPWTFVVGTFFIRGLFLLSIPLLAAFAIVVGSYERRAEPWRTLLVVIGGQIVTALATALLVAPFAGGGWAWATQLSQMLEVGPFSGGVVALGALTALMPAVWRARVRVGATAFLIAMVLNSGWLWDVEHLVAWLIGLVIGPFVMGITPRAPRLNFGRRTQRSIVALVVAVFAISTLVEACVQGSGGPFRSAGRVYESGGVTLGLVLSSLLWLVAADGLRRGRRAAWLLTTAVTAVALASLFGIASSAERTADLVLVGAQLVLLLVTFRAFTARVERHAVRRAGRRLAMVVALLFVYTAVGFAALQDDFVPDATPTDIVAEFATRLFFSTTHRIEPATTAARWFVNSIGAVWIVVLVVTVIGLVYSSRRSEPAPDQDTRIRDLLRNSPPTSIEWMLTWDGNTVWLSSDGTTGIGYRVVGAVALGLGDPVGPLDRRLDALREFDAFCFERGWIPCLFGVGTDTAALVPDVGWSAIQVAEDSVVPLENLEFKGKAWQDIRTAMNKAGKQDIRLEILNWADAKPVITDQLRAISSGWVSDKSLPEMGFTLGSLAEADDPDVRLHLAVSADGTIEGFTSWMPVSDDGEVVGWTVDLMRRRDEGFRPVMEFLIGASAMQFKEEGYQFISLSAAPLAKAPEHLETGGDQQVLQELLDFLGDTLEPYYGFRSLLNFKAKFQPQFHQMFLVFPDETALLEIGMAIARAYMPDATLVDWAKISADMLLPGGESEHAA